MFETPRTSYAFKIYKKYVYLFLNMHVKLRNIITSGSSLRMPRLVEEAVMSQVVSVIIEAGG